MSFAQMMILILTALIFVTIIGNLLAYVLGRSDNKPMYGTFAAIATATGVVLNIAAMHFSSVIQ